MRRNPSHGALVFLIQVFVQCLGSVCVRCLGIDIHPRKMGPLSQVKPRLEDLRVFVCFGHPREGQVFVLIIQTVPEGPFLATGGWIGVSTVLRVPGRGMMGHFIEIIDTRIIGCETFALVRKIKGQGARLQGPADVPGLCRLIHPLRLSHNMATGAVAHRLDLAIA